MEEVLQQLEAALAGIEGSVRALKAFGALQSNSSSWFGKKEVFVANISSCAA